MAKEKDKKRAEKDYFRQMAKTAHLAEDAALLLEEMVQNLPTQEEKTAELHSVEHEADCRYHELMNTLSQAFITPIEREDIMRLAYALDDVIDSIEDVAMRFYILNIKIARPEAMEFVKIIIDLCKAMGTAFDELRNFKKPKPLFGYLKDIDTLEEKGDEVYRRAVWSLFQKEHEMLEIYKWREMFEIMELCCDRFETLANIMQDTIMKNS